jgi:hypothetical protein
VEVFLQAVKVVWFFDDDEEYFSVFFMIVLSHCCVVLVCLLSSPCPPPRPGTGAKDVAASSKSVVLAGRGLSVRGSRCVHSLSLSFNFLCHNVTGSFHNVC